MPAEQTAARVGPAFWAMVAIALLSTALDQTFNPSGVAQALALITAALLAGAYLKRDRYSLLILLALITGVCAAAANYVWGYGQVKIYFTFGLWILFFVATPIALWMGRPAAVARANRRSPGEVSPAVAGTMVAGAIAWSLIAKLFTAALIAIAIGAYIWGGSDDAHQRCAAHHFGDDSLLANVACLVAR